MKRAVGYADQASNPVAKMFHDPPDLTVLALAYGNGQPRIAGHLPVEGGEDTAIPHTIDCHAVGKRAKTGLVNLPLNPDPVFAAPTRRRQFQMSGQITIVGQQEQTLRVHVQSTDTDQTRQIRWQPVKNGFPVLFVACAHHKAARLVVTPQLGGFACWQRFTVDDYPVTRTHIQGRAGDGFAINTDTAIGNPCLSLAARTDSGPCDAFGDTFTGR